MKLETAHKGGWLILLFWAVVTAGALITLLTGCAHTGLETRYPSAPGLTVRWMSSSEQPWPHMDLAVRAIYEELLIQFPQRPDLLQVTIEVFGANDHTLRSDSVPTGVVYAADGPHLLMGTVERDCGIGLSCNWEIRVRQTRVTRTAPPESPHLPTFGGALEDVDRSALFYEVCERYLPLRLAGSPNADPAHPTQADPASVWRSLDAELTAHYESLVHQVAPKQSSTPLPSVHAQNAH